MKHTLVAASLLTGLVLHGQTIVNESFDGTGDPNALGAPWIQESGNKLWDDGTWTNKAGAFYPLTLSGDMIYTITYEVLIPNTGSTQFGGLALVTESGPSPVDSVDSSQISKAGWFLFRENGTVDSRNFSTGSISSSNFYVPGGISGSDNSLIELILTTDATIAASTVSLNIDGVVFDMDGDDETPFSLSGVDLSGLQYIGLTGYDDHVVDNFSIVATAAIPEPRNISLLAGLVAAGALFGRRRRNL